MRTVRWNKLARLDYYEKIGYLLQLMKRTWNFFVFGTISKI
jgi:hypothetical protein